MSFETSALAYELQHDRNDAGFGTIAAAAVSTCDEHCHTRFGLLPGFDFDVNGGAGEWLSDASISNGGNSASASGVIPSAGSVSSTFVYTLDTLDAQADSNGRSGSLAVAGSLGWDDLTFHGVTPGETGTLTLTLTLSGEGSSSGTGGGCIAVDAICDPFKKSPLTDSSPTTTVSTTFALTSSPIVIFDALDALADTGHGAFGADVSGVLTLTLPSNVSFTSASGESGSPVPLPDSATLLLAGCMGLLLTGLLPRRRSPPAPVQQNHPRLRTANPRA